MLTTNRPADRPGKGALLAPLLLWLAPGIFLGLFYVFPLWSILQVSFARSGTGLAGLAVPATARVLGFTLWQAGLSTLLTLLFGLPGAYVLGRYEFRGKALVQALTSIPFVLPTLVVAAAFNALLGPRGWANLLLMDWFDLSQPPIQFMHTFTAILAAHVFYNTTIVLRMVGDFWSHLDPRLGQAAQMLGANGWQKLRHITLPLLMPAISAAALLVFIFDFTSFGVILVLGGPRFATLEVEIYYQTVSLFNLPLAATLSLIQLACTLSLTLIYTRLSAALARPLSLRPRQYTQRRLTTGRSRALVGLWLVALLGFYAIPLFSLALRSFIDFNPPGAAAPAQEPSEPGTPPRVAWRITSEYYRALNINRRDSLFYVPPTTAILVSLSYAAATVLLALSLGLPAAWALARDSFSEQRPALQNLNRTLDALLMLPLGTSAVTLGLGFIVALDHPPLDLRASPLLVPLAHTLVALPFVVRSLTPALRSIRPRLRQAAAMLGASPWQVVRAIDLPLVGRAVFVAGMFAITISLGEFGATALIARPEYPTIPVMIYRFISQPGALNYGQALALSTILMVTTAAGMLGIEKLRIADIGEF